MSYEKLGMGWSDIPITTGWIFKETTFPSCGDVPDGIKKCFTDTPDDLRCAEYSGCQNIRGEACETVSGRTGQAWCCPPDRPPPPHVAPCVPEGTRPGVVAQGMTCRFEHIPLSSLLDARARSIWTVQNKLCQLGIDPGPVNGTENSNKYRPAIRAFQARQGIPQTGEPDLVTLQAMGLTNAQSLASAIGASSLSLGVGTGPTNLLPLMMIGAFGLSGMFLFYAVRKYKRRPMFKNSRDSELREKLQAYGLSLPPKNFVLVNLRYVMGSDDWYAQEDGGKWYWYDGGKWKHLPLGPLR